MTAYPLGSSERERARLVRQGAVIRPYTERLLRNAGVRPGASILDLGSGAGDVSFLAADLVGPEGRVVGIERDADSISYARERAKNGSRNNVSFMQGDIAAPPRESFDIAIGRYVLAYQDDPHTVVKGVAACVRPGGAIAFHEFNMHERSYADIWPTPPVRHFETYAKLDLSLTRRVQNHLGVRLPEIFAAAGLDTSDWGFEGVAPLLAREDAIDQMVSIWRAFAPSAVAAGILREEDIDLEGWENWWSSTPAHACVMLPMQVLAWARKPG